MFRIKLRVSLLAVTCVASTLSAQPASTKAPGGEIVYGEQPSIVSFNPYGKAINDGPTDRFLSMIYEPLYRWDFANGKGVPVLALKSTPDKPRTPGAQSAFMVDLKPNVKWHDSTLFSADDVVFTYDYIRSSVSQNKDARADVNRAIIKISKISQSRILVEFKDADATPEQELSHLIIPVSRFVDRSMAPKDPQRTLTAVAVGTGPYQLIVGRSEPELMVNRQYHAEAGKVLAIRSREQRDNSTMVESFLGLTPGGLNMLVEVPDVHLQEVDASRQTITTGNLASYAIYAVALRQNPGSPLKDTRLRRALVQGVNRDQIRTNWFATLGRVLPGPFTPNSNYWDETSKPLPYDSIAAKAQIRALGMAGKSLKLIFKSGGQADKSLEANLAQAIIDQLKIVGINVVAEAKAPTPYLKSLHEGAPSEWDMAIVRLEFNRLYDIEPLFSSNGAGNFMRFENKAFDLAIKSAKEVRVDQRRIDLTKEAATILRDSVPAIFLVNETTIYAHTNKLNIPDGAIDSFYFFPFANLWWMSGRGR